MPTLTIEQVLEASDLGISAGLTDLVSASLGGRDVLYALNRAEGRLHEITVASDGSLSLAQTLTLSGSFAIGSEPALSLRLGGGSPELMIAGLDPASGAFVTLSGTGALLSQVSDPAAGTLAAPLDVSIGRDDGILTGTTEGLALYLETSGALGFADALADTEATYLADTLGGSVLIDGPTPYAVVASTAESGLSVIRIEPAGALSLASSFGATEGLPISAPSDIAALSRGDSTHIIVASSGSSSLTTLRLDATGDLWLTDHVLDNTDTRFQAATTLDTAMVGDTAFVAVGGADGGISLFTMLPNGRLVHLSPVIDTAETTLYRTSAISLSATATTLQIAVTSQWEAGITRLGYDIASLGAVLVMNDGDAGDGTVGHDQIVGSDLGDVINGNAGDDILYDGAGTDVLTGGAGADLFVFAADGVSDRIEDFEVGVDRLDLSGFDFLYGVNQLSITPTADGALLTFADEEIVIVTSTATPISAANFSTADILNVDRPPVLDIDQALTGGPLDDILNGGPGADTISGGGGNDTLSGSFGDDLLTGGDGADWLEGDEGNDTLDGGAGADTASGGSGDDIIDGGAGGDLLYGDEFDWVDPI